MKTCAAKARSTDGTGWPGPPRCRRRRSWEAGSRAGRCDGSRSQSDPFALGVASGDPDATGFVAWTRLAPEPLEPGGGMPAEKVEVAGRSPATRR